MEPAGLPLRGDGATPGDGEIDMKLMRIVAVFWVGLAVVALLLVGGCGGPSPSSTTVTTTTTTATSSSPTFGQLADSGKTVFASACAKCHGDQGQGITGPTLVGASANLVKYGTAQQLLSFVGTSMPLDAPGSLSHQEYLQLLCFLLVQNNDASGSAAFNENALGSVQLK